MDYGLKFNIFAHKWFIYAIFFSLALKDML
jgi:hypothetical protein